MSENDNGRWNTSGWLGEGSGGQQPRSEASPDKPQAPSDAPHTDDDTRRFAPKPDHADRATPSAPATGPETQQHTSWQPGERSGGYTARSANNSASAHGFQADSAQGVQGQGHRPVGPSTQGGALPMSAPASRLGGDRAGSVPQTGQAHAGLAPMSNSTPHAGSAPGAGQPQGAHYGAPRGTNARYVGMSGPAPAGPLGPNGPTGNGYGPSYGQGSWNEPPKRKAKRGVAGTAALALVAGLIGGAGGAGLFYGLSEPHESTSATSEPTTEIRTVASDNGVNWSQVAQEVQPSVVAIDVMTSTSGSTGSGVIIDADGHIVTNHHVIAGARQIQVTLSNGQIIPAEVVGSDASTDLAVLQLETVPDDITPATLGSSEDLIVGEPVVAIGNPLGLSSTVTTGIISALDRPVVTREDDTSEQVVTNAIQIDAAINPGNSGGPLFNASGEVIGINSSIASLTSSDGGSAGSIGLGFAIPVDLVTRVVDDLMDDGTVDHAFIGVTTVSEAVSTETGTRVGARIVEVSPGSPAEQYGLSSGDAILSINGDQLASNTALTGYVRQYAPGETIALEVYRDGSTDTIDLVLGMRE